MARNFATYYDGRWSAASDSYPMGEAKNRTSETAKDGSYIEKTLYNTWTHVIANTLSAMGIETDNTDDVVGDSQYFRSLKALINGGAVLFTDSGSANAYVIEPVYGETSELLTGVRAAFVAANSSTQASTVNVGGNGSQTLLNSSGEPVTDEIVAGELVEIMYDYDEAAWYIQSITRATETNYGKARFATDAEIASQSNVNAAVRPNNIAEMFSPSAVTSTTGSVTFPNGLIMKWGEVSGSGRGGNTVTLDEAFPNACLDVQATAIGDFSDSEYEDNFFFIGASIVSNSELNIYIRSYSSAGTAREKSARWRAIGY